MGEWNTELLNIAPGVYAYIQAKGGWFINNAGVIVGENDVIVVDSLANSKRTETFIREIRKTTSNPFSYLINTHHHVDHTWTNHMFFPAKTICHTRCREETLKEIDINPYLYTQIFPSLDVEGARATPQDISFEKEVILHQRTREGIREIRLVYVGPAHTVSDVFVHLPQEKVVFCGDLLFAEPCTPFALMGSFPGYIRAIDLLIELRADVYVPGHGPLSRGRRALEKAKEYLSFVRREAWKRFEEGMSVEEAIREIELGEYENWSERERIVGNVERAYRELRGEPVEIPLPELLEILARMMSYRKEVSG